MQYSYFLERSYELAHPFVLGSTSQLTSNVPYHILVLIYDIPATRHRPRPTTKDQFPVNQPSNRSTLPSVITRP
jgi:hypothetical protein